MISGIDYNDEEISYKRWEQNTAWDAVEEDAEGNIVSATTTDRDRSHRAKRRRVTSSVRRGLIRYVIVAIDASASAAEKDFRPSRFECVKNVMKENFIGEFFDQNPISQLSLALTRDRTAEKITDLSGNPKNHRDKLQEVKKTDGEASLENTISLAMNILRHVPDYGNRELLIICSALKTRDPGDIFLKIAEAKRAKIRISVLCLAAELFICRKMTEETGGIFGVALDANHFRELLLHHAIPPPELQRREAMTTDFVYMGFPKKTFDSYPVFATDGARTALALSSYVCPRCYARSTELPTQCNVCRLQLNQSSHIARSYHHLFPVENFIELDSLVDSSKQSEKGDRQKLTEKMSICKTGEGEKSEMISSEARCVGCMIRFELASLRLQCPKCKSIFCIECDLFIHDSLHNCPGC